MSKVHRASLGHRALAALEGRRGHVDQCGDCDAVAYELLDRTLLLLVRRNAWELQDSAAPGVVERHMEAHTIVASGEHEGLGEDCFCRSSHSCHSYHLLAGACKALLACLRGWLQQVRHCE